VEDEERGEGQRSVRAFILTGRVQGVGFRWATARKARELGLDGSVRNRDDGAVEVIAAGSTESLAALAAWLRTGPPGARVADVEEEGTSRVVPVSGFRIAR